LLKRDKLEFILAFVELNDDVAKADCAKIAGGAIGASRGVAATES